MYSRLSYHTAYLLLLLYYYNSSFTKVLSSPFLFLLLKSKGPLLHQNHLSLFKTLNTHTGFRVFSKFVFAFFFLCSRANWFLSFFTKTTKTFYYDDIMAITAGYGNAKFVDDAQVRRLEKDFTTTKRFFCCCCCWTTTLVFGLLSFLKPLLLFSLLF